MSARGKVGARRDDEASVRMEQSQWAPRRNASGKAERDSNFQVHVAGSCHQKERGNETRCEHNNIVYNIRTSSERRRSHRDTIIPAGASCVQRLERHSSLSQRTLLSMLPSVAPLSRPPRPCNSVRALGD